MNQIPSNYPREGFDEVDEPDIQQIDPRIPANEYSRPRVTSRKEPISQESFQTTVSRAIKASEPPQVNDPAAPETNKRSSTSIFGLDNIEPPKFETDPYSVKPVSMGNSMFDFEPAEEHRSNTIHGPSFLGLSDPDFLEDEEVPSHARRNWLLVALIIVIIIGAVQWRNIRDTGMQYAGTLHFKLPLKKGQGQAQVAQEKAAPSESGENSPAGEGKPEMEVNPTTNSAATADQSNSAEQSKPSQENLLTAQPTAANAKTVQPSASKNAASDTQSQPPAGHSKNDQVAAVSKNSEKNDTDSGAGTEDSEVAKARQPKMKSERASRDMETESPAAKPAPGSDDVARAVSASDPATAANWLWAATKKGNKEAPVLLADYYANGRGVPKDCEQATILLRSAARAGNPRASARLGMYYATGRCVPQDRAEAWHWLSMAHDKDPNSDWVEQYRRRLWTEMTPDERARSGSGPRASE